MSVLGAKAVESITAAGAANRRRTLILLFSETSMLKDDSLEMMREDKMETRQSRQI